VGKFIEKHFVAAFQQAGDFKVVSVDGTPQKNGGNVASYFCTPEGRVIHAVGKQVSPQRLLQEGQWALDVYRRVDSEAPDIHKHQLKIVEEAHLAKLNTNLRKYNKRVSDQLRHARESYTKTARANAKKRGRNPSEYRRIANLDSPELIARRKAAESFGGDRAHQILAAEPMAMFAQIRKRAFEKLTGEKFAEARDGVYLAAEAFEKARQRDRPILLVLYEGHGKDRDEFDNETEQLVNDVFRQRPVSQPLQSYVVVTLPLRELAALSNLADTPNYQLAANSTPSLVVTDPSGKQITAISGSISPPALAMQLWPPINHVLLARAEACAADGEIPDAMKLLRRVLKATTDEALQRKVNARLNEVTIDLAEKWAAEGRTINALRLLRDVEKESIEEPLRQLAGRRIAEIRSQL
jgi:hypothetical protein